MQEKLWEFIDNEATFIWRCADKFKSLYFPLGNESLFSSITPDLHGDIKRDDHSFLLSPVSRIDLAASRQSRNVWVNLDGKKIWSATGVSKNFGLSSQDTCTLKGGLLWHELTRENKTLGVRATILSFVPWPDGPLEVMLISLTNIGKGPCAFTPTVAIPLYCRGANSLRDHRHVSSLLERITLHRYGVVVKPTLRFDETGHIPNTTSYFTLGWDELARPPQYIYPTQEIFCGEGGDLEAPESILKNLTPPTKAQVQGREPMAGLRFKGVTLKPSASLSLIVIMGISDDKRAISASVSAFNTFKKVQRSLEATKKFWLTTANQISIDSKDALFDNWFRWVSIQPTLRRIFGCSFLPDFDYGKGGRGWRDLWQDCLGLILSDPRPVRKLLINNFSGVRMDGSNATIIGKKPGEFIADRNHISRVWMDHGVWPLLTLDLYMQETGDFKILLEDAGYFCDQHIFRSQKTNPNFDSLAGYALKCASSGKIYKGTILEHLLVQNLVQFFNVGDHNHVRLEGADWNDGLDMAAKRGGSVAFSCMYAYNLNRLAALIEKLGEPKIKIASELAVLLKNIGFGSIAAKRKALQEYFTRVQGSVSGKTIVLEAFQVAKNLREKADWMVGHIRKTEWLKEGFYNGYYDNKSRRAEGKRSGLLRMTLTAQVFAIMSQVAQEEQILKIIQSVNEHLLDKEFGGYRLNTDFKEGNHALGRAFSFVYGDKENGAFFNHMVVMYAYALYARGFVKEGWQALSSVYRMSVDSKASKIYPCLPEYFNSEGRGMYSYLTGSASWFILTISSLVFGIQAKEGNLCIRPRLSSQQFVNSTTISIERTFCARRLQIAFHNPRRLDFGRYKIIQAQLNARILPLESASSILIERSSILSLPKKRLNTIRITLG